MPAGRPTKFTPEMIAKLEAAYLMGCTDVEACLYADVSKTALYNYQEKNPEFVDRKEVLKANPVMKAKGIVLDSLEVDRDLNTAHRVIERKEGTKVKNEHTGPNGGPMQVIGSNMSVDEATALYTKMMSE